MSLEQKIEDLTGAITALTTIMERTAVNQERLLAGQEKAIAAVQAGNPATTSTRGRKSKQTEAEKTDTPNTSEELAATESGAEGASNASEPAAESPTEKSKLTFADAAKKWLDKAEKGSDEYKSRGQKIMAVLANFGAGKMSELDESNEDAAMFYLKRHAKGLTVNYDAAYDFSGPVDQPEPAAAGADNGSDDDDMFG